MERTESGVVRGALQNWAAASETELMPSAKPRVAETPPRSRFVGLTAGR